ncbi:MAG: hypothetical protein KAR20_18175 [Candidatus Heimdallarchaeota archaeon]|nr:hypothetical protein [Candidatus Heimdallarchaeota archaeon]
MPPFIEVEVINSKEDPAILLKVIEKKFDKITEGTIQWNGTEKNPILMLSFDTKEEFFQTYNKDIKIYECFMALIAEKNISIEALPPNLNNFPADDLYAIFKYRTDFKEPIRKKYYYVFKILGLLGIKISYEEVEDGFVLFYQTQEDFTLGNLNIFEMKKVKQWLEAHNIWKQAYLRCWEPLSKRS